MRTLLKVWKAYGRKVYTEDIISVSVGWLPCDSLVRCYSTWISRDYILNGEGDWWEAIYLSRVLFYAFLIIIEHWLCRKAISSFLRNTCGFIALLQQYYQWSYTPMLNYNFGQELGDFHSTYLQHLLWISPLNCIAAVTILFNRVD